MNGGFWKRQMKLRTPGMLATTDMCPVIILNDYCAPTSAHFSTSSGGPKGRHSGLTQVSAYISVQTVTRSPRRRAVKCLDDRPSRAALPNTRYCSLPIRPNYGPFSDAGLGLFLFGLHGKLCNVSCCWQIQLTSFRNNRRRADVIGRTEN